MSTTKTNHQATLRLVGRKPLVDESLQLEIKTLATRFGGGREALIPVLRDLKTRRGSIPSAAIYETARVLGIDYAKVHKVASFYTVLENIPGRLPLAS